MTLKTLQKWINHPAYFLVGLCVGLIAWSFSFDSVRNHSIFYPQRNPASLQLSELASRADLREAVLATEYRELQKFSDSEMVSKLEKLRPKWNKPQGGYTVSLAQVEAISQRRVRKLPKRFAGNPIFQLLEKVSDDVAQTDYEDLLVCDKSRLFYENRIETFPVLNDLVKDRAPASQNFSQECVIASMRQFQVPNMNFASCARSAGAPQIPGGKPCVTPALVSLTYNSYMDAAECLNLDPKHMLPKIDFESGFFLNSFGENKEAGVGQLTEVAVLEVNRRYDEYFSEIEKAAATKSSCANLVKNKSLLSMAPPQAGERCSLVGLPENPLRNIFYMALLNRMNMDSLSGMKYVAGQDLIPASGNTLVPVQNNEKDQFAGLYKYYRIKERLDSLGLRNTNSHYFKEILGTLGYHIGVETAVKLLSQYLDERRKYSLNVTLKDFDFQTSDKAQDLDGKMKDAVDVAASYVLSSVVNSKDSADEKKLKAKKRKELPRKWAQAYEETFPVYLAYRANSYDGKSIQPFALYGYPGYLSVLAKRQSEIREQFVNAELDPNTCTDPNFLKGP